ncbi:MAG: helix-turn-helix transcriptional regulator [Clostridiales bacterium]|nr:helix-turn-helix transcriptional regulator [Clostridiales bacterium]
MNERIKKLRKTLDLTQQEFADRIGLKRNTIASYETRIDREPTGSAISLICREFNVNEEWLRNGTGEMFIEVSEDDEYTRAAASIAQNNDVEIMSLLVEYWKLDDTSKEIFKNYLRNVSERIVSANPNTLTLEKANKIYEECPKTPEELEKLVIDKDDKNVC